MSLMPRSRLISDSPRSPIVAETAMRGAEQQRRPTTGPSRASATSGVATSMQASTEPAMPSHDFFGLIDGRHRVLAEQDAGRVAADVAGRPRWR